MPLCLQWHTEHASRRPLHEFEHVPAGFLNWFIVPSLQRSILEELMTDWGAGVLDQAPVEAYA